MIPLGSQEYTQNGQINEGISSTNSYSGIYQRSMLQFPVVDHFHESSFHSIKLTGDGATMIYKAFL